MARKIRQKCAACGLAFAAEDKYLGKTVKCPKCAAAVTIMDTVSADAPSSAASAARPPARPAVAPPQAGSPSSSNILAERAKPPLKPSAARIESPAAGLREPAAHPGSKGSSASLAAQRRRAASPLMVGLLLGGGALALLLTAGLAAVIYFTQLPQAEPVAVAGDGASGGVSNSSQDGAAAGTTSGSNKFPAPSGQHAGTPAIGQGAGSSFPKPGASWNVFVLDLASDRERDEVKVQIDGEDMTIPPLGPVAYSLAAGEHQLMLTRAGYEPIQYRFQLADNGQETYRPLWQRAGAGEVTARPGGDGPGRSFDDWEQDFERAKARAARENKDILIAFNGSDWCGWCIRLMYEVYFQPSFRERIDKQFVLVHIDSPQKHEAKRKVQNPRRNEQMLEKFGISGFPTLVLTDSAGRAYAKGGYVEGGVEAFMLQIVGLKQSRAERDRLFAAVETSAGKARIAAAEKVSKWLRENELLQHYGPTLAAWFEQARRDDPDNAQGVYEALFELHWMARIMSTQRNMLDQVQPILDDLAEFNAQHKFLDADRGGRMNFIAAAMLAVHEKNSEASKFVEAGLACKPKDPDVLARLEDAQSSLKFGDVLGFGTGFVVGTGGYILTNHHVVSSDDHDDADLRVFVQLAGQNEPVPAKVLAKDEENDIALLKIAESAAAGLAPLAISQRKVGRGVRVAVFGYPLSDSVGADLKLTTGGISGLPDAANNGMLLLDCRVNPGNSGGPLCDTQGNVIGMVTAKTGGFGVESYGMAQPADVLNQFLSRHLPGYTPPQVPQGSPLEWDQVDNRVSGSVLMIVLKEG